jgi:CelD/BcsL family acetyltransferase involved in cellulose biosynthesis
VKIDLFRTPALFDELADEWDALLSPLNSLNFFMRPTWQRIWWENLGKGELFVLAVRDDAGSLLGMAPLYTMQGLGARTSLGVIGGVDVTDYVDLIAAPGRERDVLGAILGFLCSTDAPDWGSLHVRNVPQSSLTLQILPELASQNGLRATIEVEDVCPVVDLPESYEQYLEGLPKKERHELRRKRRRAEANGVSYYTVGREHDIHTEIDAFLALMALYTPEKADFLKQPGHREFFKAIGPAMFAQEMLDLSFLMLDGKRAASMWSYAYGDRMMLYNSGLDPVGFSALSPGIVLLSYNIEHTIQRGFKKYDFLQGDEEYKYRMGGQTTTVHNVIVER